MVGVTAVEEIVSDNVRGAGFAYAKARFGAVFDVYLQSGEEYVELVLSMGQRGDRKSVV